MQPVPVETAEGRLAEIIEKLEAGEEVVLTRGDQPVAVLRALSTAARRVPRLRTLRGAILSIAPDFDAIPEGFEPYL